MVSHSYTIDNMLTIHRDLDFQTNEVIDKSANKKRILEFIK